jgi:ElaB/YqjD/DUF883 family membrane-anchored ribosome-binding protein
MQTRATTPDAIGRDVKNVVNEAQELLKTVQAEGSSRIDEVKSKMAAQYEHARAKLGDLQHTVADGAKVAVDETDAYVRANPWTAVAVAAGVGALIGFLCTRR